MLQTDVTFQDFLAQLLERFHRLARYFASIFKMNGLVAKTGGHIVTKKVCVLIPVDMLVEAFYRFFKYYYITGKYNKRVDNCLVNLQTYTQDKLFKRLIKLTKGKSLVQQT